MISYSTVVVLAFTYLTDMDVLLTSSTCFPPLLLLLFSFQLKIESMAQPWKSMPAVIVRYW